MAAASGDAPAKACDVVALVKRFAKPSTSFEGHDRARMAKLCETLKYFMRADFKAFVCKRSSEPLLLVYSADATPASTKEVFMRSLGAHTVRRSGRCSRDLLVQRLFVLAGDGSCKVLLDEPKTLGSKCAWAHVQAYTELAVQPRSLSHRAIVVHHYVWDRAVQSACEQKVHVVQKAMKFESAAVADLPPVVVEKLNWITSSACLCHDAHNALKWCILEYTAEPQVLRGLFVCIESLRNGFSLLMRNLRPWLREVVAYRDRPEFPHRQLWQLLGVDPNIADIAEELQLMFEDGKLCVARKFENSASLWESIELVLLSIWAFRKYSDSRWLSLGPSCRCLMAAQVVGVHDFVKWIVARPENSRYYIGGFVEHWSSAVAHLAAVVATASFPADAALAAMMEDDRVAMTVEAIEEDIKAEVKYVQSLPDEVWDVLGSRSMWDGTALRHAGVAGSLTAASFLFWRFEFLHHWPWSLVRGNLDALVT